MTGNRLFGGMAALLAAIGFAGCYHGARATQDANDAWQGGSRGELEARWGKPAAVEAAGDGVALRWTHTHRHIGLPSGEAAIDIGPDHLDARAEIRPGRTWKSSTHVIARVDAAGRIVKVDGPSLRWGAPRGANLRSGLLLGLHVGMGRLDDTETPLPSGGFYIGGMLSPTVGLVGNFSMVSGIDDDGGAMAFAWGVSALWWPAARVSLRVGPAAILAFDPERRSAPPASASM